MRLGVIRVSGGFTNLCFRIQISLAAVATVTTIVFPTGAPVSASSFTVMYQLKLHPTPKDLRVISSYDSCILRRKGLSLAPSLPSRVSPKGFSRPCYGRRNETTASVSTCGLSSEFLRHGREERARVCTRAYREEDWAKLFHPEAMKKEDLKEYLNEDPIWLWVFKSWQSGIKGALLFLWTQPGQIKYIEWPSVKSTVKMALLTLVVVMFLMVFLHTVDSLFRHLLKSSMKPMA